MVRAKYVLTREEQQLLCKFKIKKQVCINLIQLKPNVYTNKSEQFHYYAVKNVKLTNKGAHSRVARKSKPFQCKVCTYSSATESHLKLHSWTHCIHKRFKCAKCCYQTNIKSNLYRHLLTHTKQKQFVCQFCKSSFPENATKNSHAVVCMQNPKQCDPLWVDSQKRFQCKFCDQKMVTKCQLTQHMRTHTQEKPFPCDICDYAAATFGNLRRHVENKHNPNRLRSFACQLCSKTFFRNCDLYGHIRTHTKEPCSDSACAFCKKQFLRKKDCNQHQITCKLNPKQSDVEWVRQQKNFKCELCDYASSVRSNLKTHVMSHTGQRPFKSSFCKHSATTKGNLHRHLMRHTKEKPHKCLHCSYTAAQKSQITWHVKRHHSQSKLK